MERRSILKTAAALAVAGMVGTMGAAQAQDVIRIGASAPKTGPLAGGSAVSYWPAIQLWVHDVNARGGIEVGAKKMKVELIEYDDRTSNEEAIKNVQRLATVDKVDFILPPYGTGINLATAPIIARYGYPHIAVTAVTDGVDEFAKRWPNSFWTLGTSSSFATTLADVLKGMRDKGQIGSRVAVVNVADAFGIELASAGKPALQKAGFELVYDSSYPLGTQDFATIMAAAQGAKPDAFVAFSYPPDTFALTKQAAISDLQVKAFYVGVATAFPAFAKANGPAAEGVLGAGGVNASSPAFQAFFKRHVEVTGKEPDYWASAVQYSSLEVLEQAIKAAGSLDKAAVIDKVKSGSFDTVMGKWTFEGNVIRKFWTVGQWQKGVFHGVASTGTGGETAVITKQGWK